MKRRRSTSLSLFALALSLALGAGAAVSCGGDKEKGGGKKPPPKDPNAPPAKKVDPATAGNIKGVVLFEGEVPENLELPMSEPACARVHSGGAKMNKVLVTDGKLANVFVHVESGLTGYEFPPAEGEVVINQNGCIYDPLVVGARTGQNVTFLNSDPVLHNIHTFPKENDGANFAMPNQGMRTTKTFDYPEVMVPIKCDVHPWMRAYIGVVEDPYFAVTGEDGAFELKGLPPGAYTIEIWHEQYGTQTQDVQVGEKQTAEMTFTVKGS